MKIAGFCKLRNEIIREGNLYRCLANLEAVCDGGVICDDASSDGTAELLRDWCGRREGWRLIETRPEEQDFADEMRVKQRMIEALHERSGWDWIWWLDGDEELDTRPRGVPWSDSFRKWLEGEEGASHSRRHAVARGPFGTGGAAQVDLDYRDHWPPPGLRFHYTQLWRGAAWARTDGGFDDGSFVKLWRYRPDLSFDTTPGTHHQQFPRQIDYAACPEAPFDVIHYGNVGKNLVWKAIQYAEGRGGVDRHIHFGHSRETSLATGKGWDEAKWAEPNPAYRWVGQPGFQWHCHNCGLATDWQPDRGWSHTMESLANPERCLSCPTSPPDPAPFTLEEIRRIRSFGPLHRLKDHFTVIVPAFNRASTLPKALDSLLFQTYDKWIAVVLDDGSTDDTARVMREYQDKDPRIFYCRYLENRGGVAMNEIGMSLACEFTEFWTRLGSDDWFGPRKLEYDAAALAEHGACYGSYTVVRDGQFAERCNPSMPASMVRGALLSGRFLVSWANCAVRTEVLHEVRERWGSFAPSELRNCEDFIINARIAAMTDWVYRRWHPSGTVVIGHVGDLLPFNPWRDGEHGGDLEAVWTCASEGGASSPENAAILARDEQLTRELIAKELRS